MQGTVIAGQWKASVTPEASQYYFHKKCFEAQKSLYRRHYTNIREVGIGLVSKSALCPSCGYHIRGGK